MSPFQRAALQRALQKHFSVGMLQSTLQDPCGQKRASLSHGMIGRQVSPPTCQIWTRDKGDQQYGSLARSRQRLLSPLLNMPQRRKTGYRSSHPIGRMQHQGLYDASRAAALNFTDHPGCLVPFLTCNAKHRDSKTLSPSPLTS